MILQLHCAPLVPQIAKSVCSVIRDGEQGFLCHTHFYCGKIDESRLKRFLIVNSNFGRFRMVQLVWVESAEDFNSTETQYHRLFNRYS